MNYLCSTFDCCVFEKEYKKIKSYAWYEIETNSPIVVFVENSPFLFDLKSPNKNVLEIKLGMDNLYILKKINTQQNQFVATKVDGKNFSISCGENLFVAIDGKAILNTNCSFLSFGEIKQTKSAVVILFEGDRKFFVATKQDKLLFADYYDKFKFSKSEFQFMKIEHDSLNHGTVFEISDDDAKKSLIYLDDFELNMKPEFAPNVFLDCLKVGNLKYCLNLLSSDLKQTGESGVKNFFPKFDDYLCFDDFYFLLQKNTLAGVFKFQVSKNEISNIIEC